MLKEMAKLISAPRSGLVSRKDLAARHALVAWLRNAESATIASKLTLRSLAFLKSANFQLFQNALVLPELSLSSVFRNHYKIHDE
jgi:hypothetical protein